MTTTRPTHKRRKRATGGQKKYCIRINQQTWYGLNAAQAEAELDKDLERVYNGEGYEPIVIPFVSGFKAGNRVQCLAIAYRDEYGFWHSYTYAELTADSQGKLLKPCYSGHNWDVHVSRQSIEWYLRRQVAQHAHSWDGQDGSQYLDPNDIEGKKDHDRWIIFQATYKQLKAQGLSDTECHRRSCDAMNQ